MQRSRSLPGCCAFIFVIPDVLGFIFGDYAHIDTSWHSSNALQDAVVRGLRLDTIVVPFSCVVERL